MRHPSVVIIVLLLGFHFVRIECRRSASTRGYGELISRPSTERLAQFATTDGIRSSKRKRPSVAARKRAAVSGSGELARWGKQSVPKVEGVKVISQGKTISDQVGQVNNKTKREEFKNNNTPQARSLGVKATGQPQKVKTSKRRFLRGVKRDPAKQRIMIGGEPDIQAEPRQSRPSWVVPQPTRPPVSLPAIPTNMRSPSPVPVNTVPATNGSPMPLLEEYGEPASQLSTTQATGPSTTHAVCLSQEDGSFGSDDGDQVNVFFFYQVETSPGTTETQMNGVILDDIENTLVDFLIPVFFSECSTSAVASVKTTRIGTEGYVGLSSKPADFVLRGFDCTEKATEPCFIVSGSMTVYTVGMDRTEVQAAMRVAILRVMSSGTIAVAISRVNGVTLLDDSLNLATLPSTDTPIPQFTQPTTPLPTTDSPTPLATTASPTQLPTTSPPTMVPTTTSPTPLPTTKSPTMPSTTQAPSRLPTTDHPSFAPSISPSTAMPTLATTNVPSGLDATSAPTMVTPSTNPPTVTNEKPEPNASLPGTTVVPSVSQTSNMPGSISPSPWTGGHDNATLPPTQLESTSSPMSVPESEERKTTFEKVPVWAWVLMALAVCVCCTYADPDDEEDNVVSENLREQERQIMTNVNEQDKDKDQVQDSEAFSLEYFRKLYRQ